MAHAVVRDGQIDASTNPVPLIIGTSMARSFATLPDGKILVSGGLSNVSGGDTSGIARLFSDGTFDPTFTGKGSGSIDAIFVMQDGKILISGNFSQYANVPRNHIARLNADGSLDQSFNPDFGTSYVQIVALQSDQKIIVNGDFSKIGGVTQNRLARLNSDGSVDQTFTVGAGTEGGYVNKAIVLPDGKILLAGSFSSYNGVPRRGVIRLFSDGSLDAGFAPVDHGSGTIYFDLSVAPDGKIFIVGDVPGAHQLFHLNIDGSEDSSFANRTTYSGRIYAVQALSDGKVIVGGEFDGFGVNGSLYIHYRLFRFNGDGSADPSFTVQGGKGGNVRSIVLQPDQSVLVGGDFDGLDGVKRGGIGRIKPDGTPDLTFSACLAVRSSVDAIYTYPNGKMLVGGPFELIGTSPKAHVARLNADGTVDESFQVDPAVNQRIFDIAVQPDGKILLGGQRGDFLFGAIPGDGIWRVNPDGGLDTSFSAKITTLTGVNTIALQSDGKIIIGGSFTDVNGIAAARIARLNADGSVDTSFAPTGPFRVYKIVVQPDGKIIAGGTFSSINGTPASNLVRLNADGTVDTGFHIGSGANQQVTALAVLSNGLIYVGGSFSIFNGAFLISVVRLMPDGTLDPTFKGARVTGQVNSIIPLPDSKVLIGGTVSFNIGAAPRGQVLRLTSDGIVDFSFDVRSVKKLNYAAAVSQISVRPDGSVMVVGQFDSVNEVARAGIVRLATFAKVSPLVFDFEGDGITDVSLYRPASGTWFRFNSYLNSFRTLRFGTPEDIVCPADLDGDYVTDIAVFRPSTGYWYWINSSDGSSAGMQFGSMGDIPVPADYDGDGKADIAVYRPSTGTWFVIRGTKGFNAIQFGTAEDKPTVGDFDGDGIADIALFRPSEGAWFRLNSSDGSFSGVRFGQSGDIVVPADYTGDGRTDVAVWRPASGTWYVIRSEDGSFYGSQFGTNGDLPVPGDYDGDGKTDAAVFRPSSGTWFEQRSTAGFAAVQFGANGDKPAPNAYVY